MEENNKEHEHVAAHVHVFWEEAWKETEEERAEQRVFDRDRCTITTIAFEPETPSMNFTAKCNGHRRTGQGLETRGLSPHLTLSH